MVWREGEKPLARGRLELLPRAVRLDGIAGSEPATLEIPYDYLSEVRIGRTAEERLDGRPSLLIAPCTGDTVSIASIAQTGVIAEIAEQLAALQIGTERRRRIAVVLPLKHDARDAVRALLSAGPPFDPESLGLDRHEVFLTGAEAVFIFESRPGGGLEQLLQDLELWRSAAEWHAHLGGPPRIAEDVYAWTRPTVRVDRSLLPPGLRNGDSLES